MQLGLYKKGKRKDPPCELCRDFKPHFHPERLSDPDFERLPAGTRIFVCSTSDLFAPWTDQDCRDTVIRKITDPKYSHLVFQLLTKNPENVPDSIMETEFPENVWIGASITNRNDQHLDTYVRYFNCGVRFLSFEPLLGEVNCTLENVDWIIIGKLTGSRKIPLDPAWVQSLIDQARTCRIPIFIKNNVGWKERIQEFPSGVGPTPTPISTPAKE